MSGWGLILVDIPGFRLTGPVPQQTVSDTHIIQIPAASSLPLHVTVYHTGKSNDTLALRGIIPL